MINYIKDKLLFDSKVFNFREIVINEINKSLSSENLDQINDLCLIHKIPKIETRLEKYRQLLFKRFRDQDFQDLYKQFGKWLIDNHYSKDALLQKTPTARIQIPGCKSVSFHTDEWYGHGEKVNSFWLPLTRVSGLNSLQIASNPIESKKLLRLIEIEEMDLDTINKESVKICEPVDANFGELIIFSKSILHGTVLNTTKSSRISFDFRIAPSPKDTGNKPLSNFYNYQELDSNPKIEENKLNSKNLFISLAYTGIARNVSSKNQLIFLNEYAKVHNIKIILNESEIIKFDYFPVLQKYLSNPETNLNTILLFNTDLLPNSLALRKVIYGLALKNKIKLIFACEDFIFETEDQINLLENLLIK